MAPECDAYKQMELGILYYSKNTSKMEYIKNCMTVLHNDKLKLHNDNA